MSINLFIMNSLIFYRIWKNFIVVLKLTSIVEPLIYNLQLCDIINVITWKSMKVHIMTLEQGETVTSRSMFFRTELYSL